MAGGVFVLYLAFGAARAWRNYKPDDAAHAPSGRKSLLRAATINLLNPNPYIGWSLVLGPLLLKGWRESPARGIALVVGFYGTMVFCSAGIIALSAGAKSLGPRVSRALIGVSAVALAGFGSYLLWAGAGG